LALLPIYDLNILNLVWKSLFRWWVTK
jgi:hypothetical protein